MPADAHRLLLALVCLSLVGCAANRKQVREQRTGVKSVVVKGVKSISSGPLMSSLAQTATDPVHFILPFLKPKVPLLGLSWQDDRTRIANHYALQGFFDARVVGSQVLPAGKKRLDSGDPAWVKIRYQVEEGEPSFLRNVTVQVKGGRPGQPGQLADWAGTELAEQVTRELEAVIGLKPGTRFSMPAVKAGEKAASRYLASLSFWKPEVRSQVDAFPEEHAVDVRIEVWPGRRALFGSYRIEGLNKVKRRYIEDRINFVEGQPWDGAKLSSTTQDIYRLAMFGLLNVAPDPNATPTLDDEGREVVPVVVMLKERKPATMTMGPGVGFEMDRFDLHYRLSLTHFNLFGTLARGDLNLRAGPKVVSQVDWVHFVDLQTELSLPHLFKGRITPFGRFNLLLDVEKGYKYWSPDLNVGVTFVPWRALKITASYSLSYFDLFPDDAVAALQASGDLTSSDTAFEDGYFLSRMRQDITLDLRDEPLKASRGMLLRLTADEAGLGGTFRYLKLTGDLRGYAPLGTPRIVLASKIWASWVHTWGDKTSVPASEAVYAGGDGSVRGWRTNYLGPRGEVADCRSRDCVLPLGGKFGATGSLELRGNPWGPLWVAGFSDVGNVWAQIDEVGGPQAFFEALQVSLGGGIRFDTPIGRLRLDFAIHPRPWTDPKYRLPYYRKIDRSVDGPCLIARVGDGCLIAPAPAAVVTRTFTPVEPPEWNIHFGIGESF